MKICNSISLFFMYVIEDIGTFGFLNFFGFQIVSGEIILSIPPTLPKVQSVVSYRLTSKSGDIVIIT